ncbi:endonuclease/exonuclease/phosphatase family protein [Cellulomonas soli]
MHTLRVATYNLKGLRVDEAAARDVVRELAPDVLGVTEPPRGLLGPRRLRAFAAATGLRVVAGGRAARTTAVLARPDLRVGRSDAWRLPSRPGHTPRGFCLAHVGGLTVVVVHLGLVAPERLTHLERALAELPRQASVLLGDVNEQPGRPVWQRLGQDLRDAATQVGSGDPELTFPAVDPWARIDVAFVGAGIEVVDVHVPHGPLVERASDHRPLVVDLRVP